MARDDLPDDFRTRLRADVAALGKFLRPFEGKDPQGQLIAEFITRWNLYAQEQQEDVFIGLLDGLLSEAREVGVTLRIELWSDRVAPLREGYHDLIEQAFAGEVCAHYGEQCSGSDVPWFGKFFPPIPEGDNKYQQWGEALFLACLEIYDSALDGTGEDTLLKSWLYLRRDKLLQRYLQQFCQFFELKEPGQTIDERYTIEGVAGIGGMGVVYVAWLGGLMRVALKTPRPDCLDHESFAAEVQNTIKPEDLRFVTIRDFDVSPEADPPFYTMLYVDGGKSVSDIIDELDEDGSKIVGILRKKLEFEGNWLNRSEVFDAALGVLAHWRKSLPKSPLRTALSWGRRALGQVARKLDHRRSRRRGRINSPLSARFIAALIAEAAETIDYLHTFADGIGLVHRDIKPGNILLSRNSGLLISDLGLSLKMDACGQTEAQEKPRGTPGYCSPEQARGDKLTRRSDIYALGAVLHRAMTGREAVVATYGEDVRVVLEKIGTSPVPRSSPLEFWTRSPLEHIRRQAMQWEATERYATAGELAADLRRFVAGEPVTADPAFRWKRRSHRAVRSPYFRAGAAAALLALGGWYAVWRETEQIPGIEATKNKYVLHHPITRPPILPVFGSDSEYPDYKALGVDIDDSSICMDLRDATKKRSTGPVGTLANPSKEELAQIEVNPTYYTRVITLSKKFNDGRQCLVPFQFRTGGNDVYLRCLSHPATLYGNPKRESFGDITIIYRVLLVDITKETRMQFPIVIQGTIWDGFRETPGTAEKTQWAAFLSPIRQHGKIVMRFPKGMRPPLPPATNFLEKSSATATPIPMPADKVSNREMIRPPGADYWIWRVDEPEYNKYYIMKFFWSPFTPLPADLEATKRPD